MKKRGAFVIFNVPYPWVDVLYNSKQDFLDLINVFVEYFYYSNKSLKLSYPQIVF
jgi:hypothetical protein